MNLREEELAEWLRERGIEGPRRVVRESETTILVSKFGDGFSADLIARLGHLPALFDYAAHAAKFRQLAVSDPGLPRPETWHRAALAMLYQHGAANGLETAEIAEVAAGIDSVAALLDAVLFMGAVSGSNEPPTRAEHDAYRDALQRMDVDRGIFTRNYGSFDGKPVMNHCPGAKFARELFEIAWLVCANPMALPAPESIQTQPPPTAAG